jgi:hypothetical protein
LEDATGEGATLIESAREVMESLALDDHYANFLTDRAYWQLDGVPERLGN